MAGHIPGGSPNTREGSAALRRAQTQIPELTVRARPRPELMSAPLVEKEADRRTAILRNEPATFYVSENREAKPKALFATGLAEDALQRHGSRIERASVEAGIDPDLLRSIVWLENANGFYDIPLDAVAMLPGMPHVNSTVKPGNINPNLWKGLAGLSPNNVDDPDVNISASATLLGRIAARTYRPTPAKIADLYNGLGQDRTSDYGATVESLMKRKPWLPQQRPLHRY